jgi:hypothetical protein
MMLKGAEDSERIAEFYEYIRDNGVERPSLYWLAPSPV